MQTESVNGKLVYFVRQNPKGINEKTVDTDVLVGEVSGPALDNFRVLISELYLPIVKEQQQWGKAPQENTREFISGTSKFGSMLTEAVNTITGGVELRKPDPKYVEQYDLKQASYNQALTDEGAAAELEECLNEWCAETERLLNTTNKVKDGEEPGPDTELEYWRTRMSNFNSITEQLKTKECKLVLGVCGTGKTQGYARWKALDLQVTDAANEAKDNVKYLATLEKSLEPMFHGTVQDITETVPVLLNNIKVRWQPQLGGGGRVARVWFASGRVEVNAGRLCAGQANSSSWRSRCCLPPRR